MKVAVNLLPPTYRRQQLLRRRIVQWGLVLGAVLLAVWCGRWLELRKYRALRQQMEASARAGQPAQAMLREITTMRKKIDDLQEHEAVAQELEHQRQVLPVLGLISRSARFSHGKLRVMDLRAVELQSVAPDAGNNDKSIAGSVKLIGVSLDSPTVAEFHDALVQSGMFADVKLIKSNERTADGLAVLDYEVSCEL